MSLLKDKWVWISALTGLLLAVIVSVVFVEVAFAAPQRTGKINGVVEGQVVPYGSTVDPQITITGSAGGGYFYQYVWCPGGYGWGTPTSDFKNFFGVENSVTFLDNFYRDPVPDQYYTEVFQPGDTQCYWNVGYRYAGKQFRLDMLDQVAFIVRR